jgi:hypothetical protein
LVIALLSVVLATWYLLNSFASPPSLMYGFLQDDPCILPCWENITPDESSELDTLKTVIKRGLISGNPVSYPKDDWLYFFTQTDDKVSIFFLDGQVRRIAFNPSGLFPLSIMIEKLGEPEKIHMDIVGEHHTLCHASYLYYPQHGVRVEAAACDDFNRASRLATGNVMAYTPVTILSFVNVAATAEGMLESFDLSEMEMQKITSNMVDWSGYGFYSP